MTTFNLHGVALLALLVSAGCAARAKLPAPALPLIGTPRAAIPDAPRAPEVSVAITLPTLHAQTLANGLTVYVVERPGDDKVELRYVALAGGERGALEGLGLSTLAVKSTFYAAEQKRSDRALDDEEALATSTDHAASKIAASIAASKLEPTLAEIVATLQVASLPSEAVASAVTDQLDDLHRNLFEQRDLAWFHANQMLYGDEHPLGHPTVGLHENMPRFRIGQLEEHRRQVFAPETSALILVGDLSAEASLQLVAKHLGALPRVNAPPKKTPPPAPPSTKRARALLTPGRIAQIVQAYKAPPRGHADAIPFALLDVVAGASFPSRLSQALREQHQRTYSIASHYQLRRDESTWTIDTLVEPETVGETLEEIDTELLRLRSLPVTARELGLAKRMLRQRLVGRLDDGSDAADLLVELVVTAPEGQHPTARLAAELEQIERAEARDLQRVATKYLQTEQRGVAVAGPILDYEPDLYRWAGGSIDTFLPKRIADKLR